MEKFGRGVENRDEGWISSVEGWRRGMRGGEEG